MSKKEQPVTDQPAEEPTPEEKTGDLLNELRDAYEQARIDLKQTSDKLRAELKKIDVEEAGEKAKTWVKENPGLAFFLAVGAGMLVGRSLTKAMEPDPPPSLLDRARNRSDYLAGNARHFAEDAVDRFSAHASATGEQVADRVRAARGAFSGRTGALGDAIQKQANSLSETASEKSEELIHSFSEAAERAADSMQVAARDLSRSIKKQKKRNPQTLYDAILHAVKTVVGAFMFKRLNDWLRERH